VALSSQNYISCFAGIGGLDLAVRIAAPGARCVCYVEAEIPAAANLAARAAQGVLDDAPVWSDIRTFNGGAWRGLVDGVVAGFPCPDYSVAGKRAGIVGKHGQLWNSLCTVIRDVRPEWLLLENVPGITHPHQLRRWRWNRERRKWARYCLPAGLWFVLGDLAAMGFDAEWGCLSAAQVGAPHKRERIFILAYRTRRGLGMLRQSSGLAGFAYGGGEGVEKSEHARSPRTRATIECKPTPTEFSRSGAGDVANAGRNDRDGCDGKAGSGRGVCETSDAMANAEFNGRREGRKLDASRDGARGGAGSTWIS
jgi:DNA (cytosine-5)-methyltransferase 1